MDEAEWPEEWPVRLEGRCVAAIYYGARCKNPARYAMVNPRGDATKHVCGTHRNVLFRTNWR